MKRTVFISHSSKDKAIGDEVCRFLEAKGVSCWIAPRDVTPGKNYGAAIVEAINECAVFVLILSDDSNKSGQVVREVERFGFKVVQQSEGSVTMRRDV
jgi:TIR domain